MLLIKLKILYESLCIIEFIKLVWKIDKMQSTTKHLFSNSETNLINPILQEHNVKIPFIIQL